MPYGNNNIPQPGRNVIINGGCIINQIQAANTNTSQSLVGAVNIQQNNVDLAALTAANLATAIVDDSQRNDHPDLGTSGFCKSIVVTTAEAPPVAAAVGYLNFAIEGRLLVPFIGRSAVLSFAVKSPKTGIHCSTFLQAGAGVRWKAEYLVFNANTWEKKSIAIPFFGPGYAAPPLGSQLGARVLFPLIVGSGFVGAPYDWSAGGIATANQQNLLDTIGNTFRVTDVQLEAGLVSTPFDSEPFDVTLSRCQRYQWTTFPYGTVPASAAGNPLNNNFSPVVYTCYTAGIAARGAYVKYPTTMMAGGAQMTATFYNPFAAGANWGNATAAGTSGAASVAGATGYKGENSAFVGNAQAAGDALGDLLAINAVFRCPL